MTNKLSVFDLLDGDGSGLHTLKDYLFGIKDRVKTAMDAGLNSEQFASAEKVRLAIESAIEASSSLYDKLRG
ncbi:MAG: hypothetical protein IJT59_03530 [Desulfovibrionaceae bacterium]|nr:hypothetical protein [Desulfovibrionaceae bacterium]